MFGQEKCVPAFERDRNNPAGLAYPAQGGRRIKIDTGTAESAGADGIIIPKRRSASLNATVHKTSAGAASWVPVARVPNLASAIDYLKENGVWIYGTDASGENYDGVDLKGSIALVIGSEGFGMGRLIKEKCDFLLKLPMYGKITSLNASVAAGIFMYEAVRQRAKK